MSREIKFRAWDENNNEMCYVEKILDFKGNMHLILDNPKSDCFGNHYGANTDWVKLMQYTGLKDKNGKEIYEGDIIKRGNIVLNDIFEVKFDEIKVNIPQLGNSVTVKALILYDRETNYKQIMDIKQQLISIETNTEYEIIGNIYESLEVSSR